MAHRGSSSLREALKIWIQYLGVGIASIPAGVLYAVLLRGGVNQKLAIGICVVVGVLLGFFVWRFLDKRLWSERSSVNTMPSDVIANSQKVSLRSGDQTSFSRLMNEKYETLGSGVRELLAGPKPSKRTIGHALGGR